MKKLVTTVKETPELQGFIDRMLATASAADEREMFLRKQIEDLKRNCHAEGQKFWTEIDAFLKSRELIPADFDEKKTALSMEVELGAITSEPVEEYLERMRSQNPLAKLIESIRN